MKDGDAGQVFDQVALDLAWHELEVVLRRTKEACFESAKEIALRSAEDARERDGFVRRNYSDEPKKIAEWEQIMQRYEFSDDVIEDEGSKVS